ncbi:hypothetical protein Pfo_019144 [Paulownia fortunei]|nr:hypothetical protein Pfo_019144 [Paulownia fortunei]
MGQNDAASIPAMNSCWKKTYNENGSFLGNLKNHFHEFIHTPMKEHKDCFKLTWHKMIDKFSQKTTSANEESRNPATLPPDSRKYSSKSCTLLFFN